MSHLLLNLPIEILAQTTSYLHAHDIVWKLGATGDNALLTRLRNGGISHWTDHDQGDLSSKTKFVRHLRKLATVTLKLTGSETLSRRYVHSLPLRSSNYPSKPFVGRLIGLNSMTLPRPGTLHYNLLASVNRRTRSGKFVIPSLILNCFTLIAIRTSATQSSILFASYLAFLLHSKTCSSSTFTLILRSLTIYLQTSPNCTTFTTRCLFPHFHASTPSYTYSFVTAIPALSYPLI